MTPGDGVLFGTKIKEKRFKAYYETLARVEYRSSFFY